MRDSGVLKLMDKRVRTRACSTHSSNASVQSARCSNVRLRPSQQLERYDVDVNVKCDAANDIDELELPNVSRMPHHSR